MNVDAALISFAVRQPRSFVELQRAGITEDHFTDDYAKVWRWLSKMKKEHGKIPSRKVVEAKFPKVEIHLVRDRDLAIVVAEAKNRRKFMEFLDAVDEASRIDGPEDTDIAIAALQRQLNQLSMRGDRQSLVDLFSEKAAKRMLADQKKRRSGQMMGLPTGLKRFDLVTGGLQKGRMITVIARPGIGKSWLNLLFVASAVMHGGKVILYPLEMTLEETALRLYTIFSSRMFGPSKALKNLDLANGRISGKKVARLLALLQDKYEGQLLVADIGSMSDPYTVERIGAEAEIYKPDMQWVDYMTLLKAPGVGRDGGEDHTTIKALSNGMKQNAVRNNLVSGVSAQVSRDAIRGRHFLPRLETIAYGDSIGQDSDGVVSLNRRGQYLYYAMVKNRHGPEIGKTRVLFDVDEGHIEETPDQDEDEPE